MKNLIVLLLVAVAAFVYLKRPKPQPVFVPPPSAMTPAAGQTGGECISRAELDSLKAQCNAGSNKEDYERLKAKMETLERELTDTLNQLAQSWEQAREVRTSEREAIVNKIKTDVLAACGH